MMHRYLCVCQAMTTLGCDGTFVCPEKDNRRVLPECRPTPNEPEMRRHKNPFRPSIDPNASDPIPLGQIVELRRHPEFRLIFAGTESDA